MSQEREATLLRWSMVGESDSALRTRKHAAQREVEAIDRELKRRREKRKAESFSHHPNRAPAR